MSQEPAIDLEHRALDRALAEVEFFAQKRSFGPAAKRFVQFRRAFEAHLDEEEKVTFPQFEHRTGDPGQVLKTIRAQHRGLAAALDRLSSALSRSDYSEFCVGLEVLVRLLKEHQTAEEQLLQPHLHEQPRP